MIGYYDYTVVLTYLSLITSIIGITRAIEGHFTFAICCLALSGLLDMFDGKVARTKKDRTDDEKLFGVQIDSLCDVICFGIFPAVICYQLNKSNLFGLFAIAYYGVCSVIRLAYFNVLETNRQKVEEGVNKYYHGLPITSISIIYPFVFLSKVFVPTRIFPILILITLIIVGTLFIIDFPLKKPGNRTLFFLVLVTGCAVFALFAFRYHRIKKIHVTDDDIRIERIQKQE